LSANKVVWEASVDTDGIIKNPEAEKPQTWGFSFLVRTREGVNPEVKINLEAGYWVDRQWPRGNEIEVIELSTEWCKFQGMYPVKLRVLGLPKNFSSGVYLDKKLTGCLSEDALYKTSFLEGTSHLLEVDEYVPHQTGTEGTRYRCKENSLTIKTRGEPVFRYQPEYYLNILSIFGDPQGEGWYEAGTWARAKINKEEEEDYVFEGWSGDATGIRLESKPIYMNRPKTCIAEWKKEVDEDEVTPANYLNTKESPPVSESTSEESEESSREENLGMLKQPTQEEVSQKENCTETIYTNSKVEQRRDEITALLIGLCIILICISLN